jgi:phosphopentomutase
LASAKCPDAADYGDAGSDTLGNIARIRGLKLPNLARLGLGNIMPLAGIPPAAAAPAGAYGAARWRRPARTPPPATGKWWASTWPSPSRSTRTVFPPEVMSEFERRIGRRRWATRPPPAPRSSRNSAPEHMRTGSPIVYTSADSVFQVAAHEEVIPLWELYKICETAREILRGRTRWAA